MGRLFLNLAFRQFKKHTLYSIVNLLGLSVGLCAFILIAVYLQHEFTYEKQHQQWENIYRFTFINSSGQQFAICPSGMYNHVKQELPDVKEAVRLLRPYSGLSMALVQHESVSYYEQNIVYADSTFSKIFTLDLLEGDESGLRQSNGLLISARIAQKFFNTGSPIGKVMRFDQDREFFVTGVFKDFTNTHLDVDFLLPFHALTEEQDLWRFWDTKTYFLLHKGASAQAVSDKIDGLLKRHAGGDYIDLWKGFQYVLQPVRDIHFTPNIRFDDSAPVDKTKLYILGSISLAILLMSVINFVNLVTVKLSERSKEIGVSKVMGANEGTLMRQHVGEAILTSLGAGGLAYGLILLATPFFQDLTHMQIPFTFSVQMELLFRVLVLAAFTGLLAGIYPGILVQRFKPAFVLKNSYAAVPGNTRMRQGLVIVQFSATILLLAATGIIQRQLDYMQSKDTGFQMEYVLILPLHNFNRQEYATMKSTIANHSAVESIGGSSRPLGSQLGSWAFTPEGMEPGDSRGVAHVLIVDPDFISTMNLAVTQGRSFSEEITGDSIDGFIINEAAVHWFGMKAPIIGAQLNTGEIQGKIVGVVKDFNFRSLENAIAPLVLSPRSLNVFDPPENSYQYLSMRIRPGTLQEVIPYLEEEWKKIRPGVPFQYFFQDQYFDQLHREQEQLAHMVKIFTILALAIGCFGLFALTSYFSKRRRKEIGIRKVLGGSLAQMVITLSSESIKLIAVSLLIALPLTSFLMDKWLQSFAFRIEVSIGYFILIAIITIALAWLTIAYESIKTALINPAKVLKEE